MDTISFNLEFSNSCLSNRDVLSAFNQNPEKRLTIQQGMSVKEISDVVSDKIILIIKDQFQATKEEYLTKGKR